ncbi:glycoside hydrolase family 10 protein [Moniliophthora roreri]|nr:glycoside hydrolase family 10 protein [Moniliophthora roreri]
MRPADSSVNPKSKGGAVKPVNAVNSGGKIIDRISTQTHFVRWWCRCVASMQRLASAGLDIAITELDIASFDDYVAVANACLSVPQCLRYLLGCVRFQLVASGRQPHTLRPTPKAVYNAVLIAVMLRDSLTDVITEPKFQAIAFVSLLSCGSLEYRKNLEGRCETCYVVH